MKSKRRIRQARSDWRKHNEHEAKVLVLDSNNFPIDIITWKDSIAGVFSNKLKVLKYYDNDISTINGFITKCPAVVVKNTPSQINKIITTTILPMTRQNIFDLDEHKCCYCGIDLKSTIATVDHVHPLALNGLHMWDNVRASCLDCNISKGDSTLVELGINLKKRKHCYSLEKPVSKNILIKVGKMFKPTEWKNYIYW